VAVGGAPRASVAGEHLVSGAALQVALCLWRDLEAAVSTRTPVIARAACVGGGAGNRKGAGARGEGQVWRRR